MSAADAVVALVMRRLADADEARRKAFDEYMAADPAELTSDQWRRVSLAYREAALVHDALQSLAAELRVIHDENEAGR